MPTDTVLVLTVGMGANQDAEETLYRPIERSLREGQHRRIWLFPSLLSARHADHLREKLADLPISVAPPLPGDAEEDPGQCFSWFQELFDKVLADGTHAEKVVLDYTRGTKTMSAAAVLAAVSRRIERFRYVSGERGSNNLVMPGTERVREFSAAYISAARELETATALLVLQRYAAVSTVMNRWEHRYPESLHGRAQHMVACAAFWDAWDRLAYTEAAAVFEPTQASEAWFTPSAEAGRAVAFLAQERGSDLEGRCLPTWALVFDMVENARRRLEQRQFEDTLLRVYRSLELIGQAELYRYGIESDGANPERREIQGWIEYRRKEGKQVPELKRDNKRVKGYELSKELVASLLKFLKSPLANELNKFDTNRTFQAKQRNTSLLIHGFSVQATADRAKDLEGMLSVGLPAIMRKGVPDELRWIEGAVLFPRA